MKQLVVELVKKALEELGVTGIEPVVETPENPLHGDYATNVAMTVFARAKQSDKSNKYPNLTNKKFKTPLELAQAIKEAIIKYQSMSVSRIIDHVEVAHPGFINLFLTEAGLISQIGRVLELGEGYGRARLGGRAQAPSSNLPAGEAWLKAQKGGKHKGEKRGQKAVVIGQKSWRKLVNLTSHNLRIKSAKRIMVEFADPNPFKEFHIGHLRNITLGESYCRLLEAAGHMVRRVNYQGDVGMHVAKCLYGILQNSKFKIQSSKLITPREKAEFLGKAYAIGAKAFEEDDKAKQKMIHLNKKIYAQDPTVIDVWKEGRKWSLDYFDTFYGRLGTKFERFYFESEVAPLGVKIVREHVSDGVFEQSDGAIVFRGEHVGLHTRVFVSKEGYATYEAKDLALAPLKYSEWPYDLSIIMTGNEQSEYFKVMLAALAKISADLAAKTRHMPFGMVNLKEGKMSSRTGNVIAADWLIDQAKEKIRAIVQKTDANYSKKDQEIIAEKAAVAAVKYSMLRVTAISDIAFDLEASVSFEGDSGPYLQYAYARCRSVLRKAAEAQNLKSKVQNTSKVQNSKSQALEHLNLEFILDFELGALSLNGEERSVARLLSQFPDVVADAAAIFSPNTICTYLFQLAQAFNLFYAKHTILAGGGGSVKSVNASTVSVQDQNTDTLTHRHTDTIMLRVMLTAATAQVLKNGLHLLGIEVLEQM